MEVTRRKLFIGTAALLAAPALVRAASIMPIHAPLICSMEHGADGWVTLTNMAVCEMGRLYTKRGAHSRYYAGPLSVPSRGIAITSKEPFQIVWYGVSLA